GIPRPRRSRPGRARLHPRARARRAARDLPHARPRRRRGDHVSVSSLRILYLAPDPVPAPKGAGVRIERTVRTLVELGHRVELFTPHFASRQPGNALPAEAAPRTLDHLPHDAVPIAGEGYLERMLGLRDA